MKKAHHALTITATAELLKFWSQKNYNHIKVTNLNKIIQLMEDGAQLRDMEHWVVQADNLEDVVVEEGLAKIVIEKISKPTRFQHFAYCGIMGKLEDGNTVLKKYDGYCWDCDPYLSWYLEIANISWADVRFISNCGVFDEAFFNRSPGAQKINGDTDWDDQIYPSAIEMADFYGKEAREYANNKEKAHWSIQSLCFALHMLQDLGIPLYPSAIEMADFYGKEAREYANNKEKAHWSIQSLCFALHMLQDLGIPHHVLCTVDFEHSSFEQKMLDFWKRLYSNRSRSNKERILEKQISPLVIELLDGQLRSVNSFKQLGKKLVDQTCKRLQAQNLIPSENKIESRSITVQGIAGTIKAIELFYA